MGKDQELLEAARSGNVTVVEKILGQRAKRSGPLARWVSTDSYTRAASCVFSVILDNHPASYRPKFVSVRTEEVATSIFSNFFRYSPFAGTAYTYEDFFFQSPPVVYVNFHLFAGTFCWFVLCQCGPGRFRALRSTERFFNARKTR